MTIKELRQIIREELQTVMREELREILTEAVQIASGAENKSENEEEVRPSVALEQRMPQRSEVSEMIRNSVTFEGGFGSLLAETAKGMTSSDFADMDGTGNSSAPISPIEESFMNRAKKVYEASLKVKKDR